MNFNIYLYFYLFRQKKIPASFKERKNIIYTDFDKN